jgi:hypothetical protein
VDSAPAEVSPEASERTPDSALPDPDLALKEEALEAVEASADGDSLPEATATKEDSALKEDLA